MPTMSLLQKLMYPTAALSATAGACLAVERLPGAFDTDSTLGTVAFPIITAVRFTRSLKTAAMIMADYRRLFAQFSDYQSPDYKAARSVVHARSADRLLRLARAQGAVYVKIGQHVASMNHAVPPEYSQKLKLLEDRAAFRPFWQIERSLKRQMGLAKLRDVFDEFDQVPVAAASLAQVHRATLRDTGDAVAVKVQYPGLEALVRGDLRSILILSWLLKWVFPFFNMDWVVDQFRVNLAKELDFRLEAQSANRTAKLFEQDPTVGVPHVHDEHSGKRVLVMEYIDGSRVDDVEAMRRAGVDPAEVAQAVVRVFAQMIFINGFVHCDPHAGNLMVRPGANGRFELFLLDHGLYRELNDSFRQNYCRLWKGLVLRRSVDVERACDELGAPGFANLFSIFLLNRSWNFARLIGTDIRMRMSSEEMSQLRKDLRGKGVTSQSDMSEIAEQIPDDLLLVFKMNSLVRNVNRALGASVNRFKVNARYAVRGLRHFNGPPDGSGDLVNGAVVVASTHVEQARWRIGDGVAWIFHVVGRAFDIVCLEVHLAALDVGLVALQWWSKRRISDTRGLGPSSGLSEAINLIG